MLRKVMVEAPENMTKEVIAMMNNRNEMESKVTFVLGNKENLRANEVYDLWKGDLVISYRIHIDEENAIVISEDILYYYFGNDMDKIRQLAKENTPRINPIKFRGINEVMAEMMPGLPPMPGESPFYVLTNESVTRGAATILYPDVLDVIRENVEGNFYIVPSSIHELLIVPIKDIDGNELKEIIGEVNSAVVDPIDYLGDEALICVDGKIYTREEYGL